jgi:two-component sensor histidine kinase
MIHGIFEKPSKTGTILVRTRREGDRIRITIEDDGVGWKGTGTTQGTGLGTRVVTAMAANLQSKVEYDSGVEGTRASFRFRI